MTGMASLHCSVGNNDDWPLRADLNGVTVTFLQGGKRSFRVTLLDRIMNE
jgi:hypothetical protein